MNTLYVAALVGILLLFLWKKYVTHTKRQKQYIQYLQTQIQKLESSIQDQSYPEESYQDENQYPSNNIAFAHVNPLAGLSAQEVVIMGSQLYPEQQAPVQVQEVEEVDEEEPSPLVVERNNNEGELEMLSRQEVEEENRTENDQVNEIQEVDVTQDAKRHLLNEYLRSTGVCNEEGLETEDDPEKVPLMEADRKPNSEKTDINEVKECNDEVKGRCCVQPIIEENFADVPETLFDRGTISVAEDDPTWGVQASNAVDDRKFLEKQDLSEELQGDVVVLTQTKQMHCTKILKSGKRKGEMCGRKTVKDGMCHIHGH
jgi:hypothetical protein